MNWKATSVPQCQPGFIDVTDGKAYSWACAHYCPGGPNFAQANCQCACMTQDQIDRLNIIIGQVPTLAPDATQGSGQDLVTRAPRITTEPHDPVVEIPVGDFGGEDDRPAPVVDKWYLDENPDAEPQEVPDPAAGQVDTTLIVIIASSSFCCLALVMLGCACYTGLLMRKPARVADLVYVDTPAISLQSPSDACPIPGVPGQVSSRASSRTSCGSRAPQERSASRRSSNVSGNVVYTNQAGGPFYNPQDLEGRSASRRSSNVSNCGLQVGGPFYNPQDLQAQGRSSSRRSSNAPQDVPGTHSRRNSHSGTDGAGTAWAHVPSDDRNLVPSNSKLSVQSRRSDHSPGGQSSGDSPERHVTTQPRSATQGTHTTKQSHLSATDALSVPSNRRPSKGSNLTTDMIPGSVPGSRRGSKASNASMS